MLESHHNPTPKTDWTFDQWLDAAGGKSGYITLRQVIDIAAELGLTPPNAPWIVSTLQSRSKSGFSREDALKIITVLREIATRNRSTLFSNPHVEAHSRIFLRSNACKAKYAEPDADELWEICRQYLDLEAVATKTSDELTELRSRVHPRPPDKLFGRHADWQRLMAEINERYVSVIDAAAGDGKTALAWHAAIEMWGQGRFTDFDWTSDKRHIVDAFGKVIKMNHPELDFVGVLRSMVKRFRWTDLLGKDDEQLLNGCADHLRKGHYLLVVDNLETMPDHQLVVRRLQDMLTPSPVRPHAIQLSRAVITSRVSIMTADCGRVSIEGIEPNEREAYIDYLEAQKQTFQPLSPMNKQTLANLTGGSPLLLQIAVNQYTVDPTAQTFDEIVNAFDNGRQRAFPSLFRSLLNQLDDMALTLAYTAAQESFVEEHGYIYRNDLRDAFEVNAESMVGISPKNLTMGFVEALNTLEMNRVLSPVDMHRFSMHPLIRAYLYGMEREQESRL